MNFNAQPPGTRDLGFLRPQRLGPSVLSLCFLKYVSPHFLSYCPKVSRSTSVIIFHWEETRQLAQWAPSAQMLYYHLPGPSSPFLWDFDLSSTQYLLNVTPVFLGLVSRYIRNMRSGNRKGGFRDCWGVTGGAQGFGQKQADSVRLTCPHSELHLLSGEGEDEGGSVSVPSSVQRQDCPSVEGPLFRGGSHVLGLSSCLQ